MKLQVPGVYRNLWDILGPGCLPNVAADQAEDSLREAGDRHNLNRARKLDGQLIHYYEPWKLGVCHTCRKPLESDAGGTCKKCLDWLRKLAEREIDLF